MIVLYDNKNKEKMDLNQQNQEQINREELYKNQIKCIGCNFVENFSILQDNTKAKDVRDIYSALIYGIANDKSNKNYNLYLDTMLKYNYIWDGTYTINQNFIQWAKEKAQTEKFEQLNNMYYNSWLYQIKHNIYDYVVHRNNNNNNNIYNRITSSDISYIKFGITRFYIAIAECPWLSANNKNELLYECLNNSNDEKSKKIAGALVDYIAEEYTYNSKISSEIINKCCKIRPTTLYYIYKKNPQEAEKLADELGIELNICIYDYILEQIQNIKYYETLILPAGEYYNMIIKTPKLQDEQRNELMAKCLDMLNNYGSDVECAATASDLAEIVIKNIDKFNFNIDVFKKCLETDYNILLSTYNKNPERIKNLIDKLGIDINTFIYNYALQWIQNMGKALLPYGYCTMIIQLPTLSDEQKNELIIKCLDCFMDDNNRNIENGDGIMFANFIIENADKFNFNIDVFTKCYEIDSNILPKMFNTNLQGAEKLANRFGIDLFKLWFESFEKNKLPLHWLDPTSKIFKNRDTAIKEFFNSVLYKISYTDTSLIENLQQCDMETVREAIFKYKTDIIFAYQNNLKHYYYFPQSAKVNATDLKELLKDKFQFDVNKLVEQIQEELMRRCNNIGLGFKQFIKINAYQKSCKDEYIISLSYVLKHIDGLAENTLIKKINNDNTLQQLIKNFDELSLTAKQEHIAINLIVNTIKLNFLNNVFNKEGLLDCDKINEYTDFITLLNVNVSNQDFTVKELINFATKSDIGTAITLGLENELKQINELASNKHLTISNKTNKIAELRKCIKSENQELYYNYIMDVISYNNFVMDVDLYDEELPWITTNIINTDIIDNKQKNDLIEAYLYQLDTKEEKEKIIKLVKYIVQDDKFKYSNIVNDICRTIIIKYNKSGLVPDDEVNNVMLKLKQKEFTNLLQEVKQNKELSKQLQDQSTVIE